MSQKRSSQLSLVIFLGIVLSFSFPAWGQEFIWEGNGTLHITQKITNTETGKTFTPRGVLPVDVVAQFAYDPYYYSHDSEPNVFCESLGPFPCSPYSRDLGVVVTFQITGDSPAIQPSWNGRLIYSWPYAGLVSVNPRMTTLATSDLGCLDIGGGSPGCQLGWDPVNGMDIIYHSTSTIQISKSNGKMTIKGKFNLGGDNVLTWGQAYSGTINATLWPLSQ